jgi:hypothetical protein
LSPRPPLRSRAIAGNRFSICLGDGSPPIDWTPPDPAQTVRRDCVYFGGALRELDRRLSGAGLTFFLTWDVHELPRYGPDVVAVVLGDEDSRIPAYADRVRAIFKTYGSRPYAGLSPLRDRTQVSALVAVETARRWKRRLPGTRFGARSTAPIHPIPLGYYNQTDVPFVAFEQRPTAVHFAGTPGYEQRSRLSPRRWLRRPHPVSRRAMLDALRDYAAAHPELPIVARETGSFLQHRTQDAAAYSRELMDTRIVLAPRGGSVETYRWFEALRAGCVVVCEPQPPTWFYTGAPIVTVRDWRRLGPVLDELLADERGLRERHEASLAWWRDRCSEEALAGFMERELRA